jgi:hypothetical protein
MNEYDKVFNAIVDTTFYHIHSTIEASSRDANQFRHNVALYCSKITADIIHQYEAIYQTYITAYGGTRSKKSTIDSMLYEKSYDRQTLDKLRSKAKAIIISRIIILAINSYLYDITTIDADSYFRSSGGFNKQTLIEKLRGCLKTASINIAFEMGSTKKTVPYEQYQDLLKRYKRLEIKYENTQKPDLITEFIEGL